MIKLNLEILLEDDGTWKIGYSDKTNDGYYVENQRSYGRDIKRLFWRWFRVETKKMKAEAKRFWKALKRKA